MDPEDRHLRSTRSAILLALACVLVVSSCVTPAFSTQSYEHKVEHAAERLYSILASARLGAELMLEGRVLRRVADSIISDAESDADSVVSALDSVQPPDSLSLARWSRAHDLMSAAADDLTQLRMAERRHDDAAVRQRLAAVIAAARDVHDTYGLS